MDNPLLQIIDLKTHFFLPEGVVRAVDGVSFDIEKGKCVGVLGESGCGKSVTAMSTLRLIPDPPGKTVHGSVLFEGQDLVTVPMSQMRKIRGGQISMIFQEPMTALNPLYTVGQQISATFREHKRVNKKEGIAKAVEMLDMVGIPSPEKRVDEYPHQLSGGMRQRAMIAMAMACQPKLLIADEPTTALDVTIQVQILDLIAKLQKEQEMAVMLITHDLGVISEMADKVVVMYAGLVVETAPIGPLFDDPRHPYTRGLMRSLPKLGSKKEHGNQSLPELKGMVPNLINPPEGCLFAPRCSQVMEKCSQLRPPLFTVGEERQACCWLEEK